MSGFDLDDTIELLRRTPAVLDAMLRELPAAWLLSDEGPGTWTPVDVVRHLLHGEHVDWLPRASSMMRHDTPQVWDAFDPDGADAYTHGKSLPSLLDELAAMRSANLDALVALRISGPDLDRTAVHATFGEVTLRQHLATWAAHDLDHLRQAARALALRHHEAIGPWSAFLTIMD